jgi:hypothetical protein
MTALHHPHATRLQLRDVLFRKHTDDRVRTAISERLDLEFYRMLEELEEAPERGVIRSP